MVNVAGRRNVGARVEKDKWPAFWRRVRPPKEMCSCEPGHRSAHAPHTHMHVYTYIYIHIYIYTYRHVHIHIDMYIYI